MEPQVTVDEQGVKTLLSSPEVSRAVEELGQKIIEAAKDEFLRQVKHTHPVTPPPYADSFFVEKVETLEGTAVRAGNDDPAAIFVEYGEHPRGSDTEVLKYAPLRRGMDRVEGES